MGMGFKRGEVEIKVPTIVIEEVSEADFITWIPVEIEMFDRPFDVGY